MSVSEQLREELARAPVTCAEIARQTGIDEATLSRFKNRRAGMSLRNLDRLAGVLGLRLCPPGRRRGRV